MSRLKSFRERFSFLEPAILGGLIVFVCLIWGFSEVAEEVLEGDTKTIDTFILTLMRNKADPLMPWGPLWFQEMMRDISGLGGIVILSFVSICAAMYLFMLGKKGQAFYLLCTVSLGTLIANILKYGFDRPRPDLFPHGSFVYTGSFPSGHSMMSAIVYLSIGALLARSQSGLKMKIYFMGLAVFLSIAIGVSRIYLGVHWPSDVLAGWIAGAICAIFFWLIEWAYQEKILSKLFPSKSH